MCVLGGGELGGKTAGRKGLPSVGWDILKPTSVSELRPDWQDDLEWPLRTLNPASQGCFEEENSPGESVPSVTNVCVSSNSVYFKETSVLS